MPINGRYLLLSNDKMIINQRKSTYGTLLSSLWLDVIQYISSLINSNNNTGTIDCCVGSTPGNNLHIVLYHTSIRKVRSEKGILLSLPNINLYESTKIVIMETRTKSYLTAFDVMRVLTAFVLY